ncbi:MAG: bifunctional glutamate N-acetyltransferase/amino-acid acetyltransferase ArgJ [Microbacteriaceae bacterium]|nr:bifunctional glutamate N-acetyltransferase/amino-acid acetyltransferase ArgJ [Microbacteriaceae bacterium]MDR9443711.1 bifunctional glutamate N-acetyltransferase/amino-acid acetyltransferase ArgJ [Microbacteriaceae bacterium]
MSVTYAKGFLASGVEAGLKAKGKDFALIVNSGPSDECANVFTSNRALANPVIWSQEVSKTGKARAVAINSGGANCFTGSQGFQLTHKTAERAAELLNFAPIEVLVASTGLIGEQLDESKIMLGLESASKSLSDSGGYLAAEAMMTTDSVHKHAIRDGSGYSIGGIAKGAGMLAPALATMLVFITTDASIDSTKLQKQLELAVEKSFNRLDSDGCTSTNDHVMLMANGASGVEPEDAEFQMLLDELCMDLAMQLLKDAEGADHDIHIKVLGAESEELAVEVARSVARNNLFKAAIYGADPNWGRIYAAIGTVQGNFDPMVSKLTINGVCVADDSMPQEDRSQVDLTERLVEIEIDLKNGEAEATVFTNDLTHAYVSENSEYSS